MSDQDPSGKPPKAGGDGDDGGNVDFKTHSKLLGEKKKLQSQFEEMKLKLDEYEQGKLEAEGKLKEALENQKRLTTESQGKLKELFAKVAQKTLKAKFASEVQKMGCVDADVAYLACDFEGLDITQDLDFDEAELKTRVEKLVKDKPFLFKKDVKLPNDTTPGNGQNNPTKNLSEMSDSDLKSMLAQTMRQ